MTRLKILAVLATPLALAATACSPQEAQPGNGAAENAGADHDGHDAHNDHDHDNMDHGQMDHGAMDPGEHDSHANHAMGATAEASADGVLNAIDMAAGTVNITHPPMPEIGWPEMTMDLPVTRQVDLSEFEAGQSVRFTVRRGRDDVFRIVAMQPAEAAQ